MKRCSTDVTRYSEGKLWERSTRISVDGIDYYMIVVKRTQVVKYIKIADYAGTAYRTSLPTYIINNDYSAILSRITSVLRKCKGWMTAREIADEIDSDSITVATVLKSATGITKRTADGIYEYKVKA